MAPTALDLLKAGYSFKLFSRVNTAPCFRTSLDSAATETVPWFISIFKLHQCHLASLTSWRLSIVLKSLQMWLYAISVRVLVIQGT